MTKSKSTQRLTAQRKLELYLATRAPDAPVGEILRAYGLHLDDLREIEQTIESAALAALKVHSRHGRQPRSSSKNMNRLRAFSYTEGRRVLSAYCDRGKRPRPV